jgi:lipid-binding SYLF domain-containing protein
MVGGNKGGLPMTRNRALWTFLLALLAVPSLGAGGALAQGGEQVLVDKAEIALSAMRNEMGPTQASDLLRRARAVMIVPEMTKGGFIFGGQAGGGVLLAHLPNGGWSYPAFYAIGGGTFGLQIGVQQAQMVFLIMSDNALQAWLRDQVKFGGQDGIAVFVTGPQSKQNAMTQDRADVVAWAHATGAYAGITVEGTSVSFDHDGTARYYGRPLTPDEILLHGAAYNASAERLRGALVTR